MNTKFTKGEWKLAEGKTYCAIRTEESIITDMRTANGIYNKHDAQLITTAKYMYAMLKKLIDESRLVYGEDYDDVEDLLAKARGEL